MSANQTKLLILLVTFVAFVNYMNYFLPDRKKLNNTIILLETKIAKNERLNHQKISKEQLLVKEKKLFFTNKKNYSQSMGEMQEMLQDAAKGLCTVKRMQWSQVPAGTSWYERMKISLSIVCSPKDIFTFVDRLQKREKLFILEDSKIVVPKKAKQKLQFSTNVVAFRMKDAI
ncbi:hypothetical protein LCX93_01370 [Sulfurimonas sp. SWIR-19]|uniref:hypothetical protein n=1 Tax=Sulfurimonas sp. SWIR-19 TaxID=2878390 RepID=UPI001CF5CA93|nr:hypothetical protein [Sulfurimonas sp. SWIR-19]UCN00593.1 hypothetical protein LCX93_01370 [Sulfurimonas sp. SWIR-19]